MLQRILTGLPNVRVRSQIEFLTIFCNISLCTAADPYKYYCLNLALCHILATTQPTTWLKLCDVDCCYLVCELGKSGQPSKSKPI